MKHLTEQQLKNAATAMDVLFIIIAVVGVSAILHGSIIAGMIMPVACGALCWGADAVEKNIRKYHG